MIIKSRVLALSYSDIGCKSFGYENVLNRRGTTWRKLDAETQATINEETGHSTHAGITLHD